MSRAKPATLLDDLGWCWWTQPRATMIDDVLYVGGVDSAGSIVVATFDGDGALMHAERLARFEDDDHNNPAVLAAAGRRLLAVYSRHSEDDVLRVRTSAAPLDPTSWGPERPLRFGGVTSYAQVHALGDELHLFTRAGETAWWYASSPDWGDTWTAPRPFVAPNTDWLVYMPTALLDDHTTLRVAVSGHPSDRGQPVHDVFACVVDLASGAVTLPASGATVANLRCGAGLPLGLDALDLVHRTPTDRTVNLFDVSDGPQFEVAFTSKVRDDTATIDAQYHVSRLTAEGWVNEPISPAGTIFGYIHAGFYAGGMAFPHRTGGGRVYASREKAGRWHVEQWCRTAAGWTAHALVEPSRERLVRPWAVTGASAAYDVLALALDHYGADYCGTRSRLVGLRSAMCSHAP